MRLIAFTVEGYRRFVAKTSVKVHGDMIALVGPNEAGKSSILRAISHLHNRDAFAATELPRRTGATPRLAWHFQLDDSAKTAIADVHDASGVERLVITKKSDAARTWSFEPTAPRRDRSQRTPAIEGLRRWRDDPAIGDAGTNGRLDLETYDQVLSDLNDLEDYAESDLGRMRVFVDALTGLAQPEVAHEDDAAGEAAHFSGFWAEQGAVCTALAKALEWELRPSPWRQCVDLLTPLVPTIELFGPEDRDLASQYDIEEVAENAPAALNPEVLT